MVWMFLPKTGAPVPDVFGISTLTLSASGGVSGGSEVLGEVQKRPLGCSFSGQ